MPTVRRRRLPYLVILLAAFLAPSRGHAAEYHLATTGDDANAGSTGAAVRTLKKSLSVLKPGKTLYVKDGTYPGVIECGAFPSGDSWEKPVTIAAHPGHRPVIVPPGKGEVCLYVVAASHL